jgi:predicted transcriptional regulator of viral defense system
MKNTSLSEKDAKLIEKAIAQYGRLLSVGKLIALLKETYSEASAHNRISQLARSGWLKRIKQGLYLISDSVSARSQNDISLALIANSLIDNSYVSLSYALNYYQMYDQYGKTITSITIKSGKKYIFDEHIFKFSKVKNDQYFGFVKKREAGKIIRIAKAEKALIDYLYLDKSFGSASLVFEKIREHKSELDLGKLQEYAVRSGLTITRKIGFMLDVLNINSEQLFDVVRNKTGFSRFRVDSKLFNAKWRVYYDDRIIG